MYVSEICAEGIFVTFPWWLKNVKSRSKIALFSNEPHFEIWFPKKKTITFFWSKLSKLHKKRPNFACDNYIFPKTKRNKNKPWTHLPPFNFFFFKIQHYCTTFQVWRIFFFQIFCWLRMHKICKSKFSGRIGQAMILGTCIFVV